MQHKHLVLKVILVTFLTTFLCSSAYPYIENNGAGGGYDGSYVTRVFAAIR